MNVTFINRKIIDVLCMITMAYLIKILRHQWQVLHVDLLEKQWFKLTTNAFNGEGSLQIQRLAWKLENIWCPLVANTS